MILWVIRQLLALRQAVAGRARPSELAWGFALGIAIGLIPKGNLISVLLIGFVVTLKVNHGLAALTAVACTFASGLLDPLSHLIGGTLLEVPFVRNRFDRLWDAPLVAWSDLNNTVVLGSTTLAIAAVVPSAMTTLPIFRWLSPQGKRAEVPQEAFVEDCEMETRETLGRVLASAPSHPTRQSDCGRLGPPEAAGEAREHQGRGAGDCMPHQGDSRSVKTDNSMNEALGYLLNRLHDVRDEGRAA